MSRQFLRLLTLALLALLVLTPLDVSAQEPAADEPQAQLSDAERSGLQALLKSGLIYVPPAEAKRARVAAKRYTVWGSHEVLPREGWLVKDEAGQRTVHFEDGSSLPDPVEVEVLDFVTVSKKRYAPPPADESRDDMIRRLQREAMLRNQPRTPALIEAAWLLAQDEEETAALALAAARRGPGRPTFTRRPVADTSVEDLTAALRSELAWAAFHDLVHAYMVSADEFAQAAGQRLLERYPDEAEEIPQAKRILAELQRRRQAGTFGKQSDPELPAELAGWPAEKQVAWLIERLDQVDARQWEQDSPVDMSNDVRVAALVELDAAAVEPLLECLAEDERLTRSVSFWRHFARPRTVLAVREAALAALSGILRLSFFEPEGNGDSFTVRGPEEVARTAARIRAYWDKNKHLTLEQRLLAALIRQGAKPEERREAAQNLVRRGSEPTARAAVLALAGPSAAEALLSALDAELNATPRGPASLELNLRRFRDELIVFRLTEQDAAYQAGLRTGDAVLEAAGRPVRGRQEQLERIVREHQPGDRLELLVSRRGTERTVTVTLGEGEPDPEELDPDHWPRLRVVSFYADCLDVLADERVGPELARRAGAAQGTEERAVWALSAVKHGQPQALDALAAAAAEGQLDLSDPGRGEREVMFAEESQGPLPVLLNALAAAERPAADEALAKIASPAHPYFAQTVALLDELSGWGGPDTGLLRHPFVLRLWLAQLADTELSGATFSLTENGRVLSEESPRSSSTMPTPAWLQRAETETSVEARRCDLAAQRLSEQLLGLPRFHCLLQARDDLLSRLKQAATRLLAGKLRRAEQRELLALGRNPGMSEWQAIFLPDLQVLERAATPADVAAGRALFSLEQGTRLEAPRLPARALVTVDGAPAAVLVFQAERDQAGAVFYGVVGEGISGKLPAAELHALTPLPDPAAQLAAALAFVKALEARDQQATREFLGEEARRMIESPGGPGWEGFFTSVAQGIEELGAAGFAEVLAPRFKLDADGKWRIE